VLKFLTVDEEGDRLAVDVFGQRAVAMAGEAVFVFEFVLGTSGEGRAQQKESERTEQDSAGNFHDTRKRRMRLDGGDWSHKVWGKESQDRFIEIQIRKEQYQGMASSRAVTRRCIFMVAGFSRCFLCS
jgi:hypothetical protein